MKATGIVVQVSGEEGRLSSSHHLQEGSGQLRGSRLSLNFDDAIMNIFEDKPTFLTQRAVCMFLLFFNNMNEGCWDLPSPCTLHPG